MFDKGKRVSDKVIPIEKFDDLNETKENSVEENNLKVVLQANIFKILKWKDLK